MNVIKRLIDRLLFPRAFKIRNNRYAGSPIKSAPGELRSVKKQNMNIYRINIWGPCRSERDVLARRSDPPDNTAIVVAPSKDIANQVCYLVATRDAHGQSNYQEIDSFASPVAGILDTTQEPFTFESDVVDDLIANPILPGVVHSDTQTAAAALFFAHCTDNTGKTRGQFWVYAPDAASANIVATE
jgi:hypothetical protein